MMLITRKHVSMWFNMKIPSSFSRRHLPMEDTLMTLETESGELYEVKYLSRHNEFSGGWKRFAIGEKLVVGDHVAFHLVEATRFKVYITRKDSSTAKLPTDIPNLYKMATQCDPDDNQVIVSNNEIKLSVLVQVWNGINTEQPVFLKLVFNSQIFGYFQMKIPVCFCRRYLSTEDKLMTFETESGEHYEVHYLPQSSKFSGGWKTFVITEKLAEGDYVLFHLVEATRFKVYIIRKGSSTVKLPTDLLKLYKKATQCDLDDNQLLVYNRRKVSRNYGDESCRKTDVFNINFNNIKGFNDFKTVINEMLQNHELSELCLQAYYELCRTQNLFLHANLLKGLNSEPGVNAIISTIISKIVSISIALRTCTLSTFLNSFSEWNKTLTQYEALGMNVGVLRSRLDHLRNLALSSDGAVSRNRYIKACHERSRCECEVKKLETVLAKWRKLEATFDCETKGFESKAGWEKYMEVLFRRIQAKDEIREIEGLIVDFGKFFEHYDDVIETLKLKADNHEHQFQEEIGAPW